MISIVLAAALLFPIPQQGDPTPSQPADLTQQQRLEQAHARHELTRQVAIHVNQLASDIHSEDDARAFVDAVAEQWSGQRYLLWTALGIRRRLAHSEFEAVSDPSRLIPEQRIVNVWNEYVREIDAPEEALVTVAEIHNMRDALYAMDQRLWNREFLQSIWTAPAIHAADADGNLAGGCRAIEALKLLDTLSSKFQNLRSARERVQHGYLLSDRLKQHPANAKPAPAQTRGLLQASFQNPVEAADRRYVQDHGARDYAELLERLFEELFPKE